MPAINFYFPPNWPDPDEANRTRRLNATLDDGGLCEFTVGRAPTLDLTLAVKTVSRRHCAVSYSYASGRWAILDLGSSGGTWVNNQRLEPYLWRTLEIGDKLHLSSNPPISVVEDEFDTVGDDGPTTVASLTPLDATMATMPPDRGYDDALYLAVSWLTGGRTWVEKIARYSLMMLLTALALGVVALIFFH